MLNQFMLPRLSTIPEFLRKLPYWNAWAAVNRNGKLTKPPVSAIGTLAKVNDTSTWTDFTTAWEFYEANKGKKLRGINGPIAGVGALLQQDFDLVGIDFDKILEADGKIAEWAMPFIQSLSKCAYCEVSPSKTGIHAYLYGKKPKKACRRDDLEIYAQSRFLTITGWKLPDCPDMPAGGAEAQAIINELMEYIARDKGQTSTGREIDANEWIAAADAYVASAVESYGAERSLNDDEVIEKASTAKNGGQFTRLFYHGDSGYPSPSEAELALCNKLAWWTRKDAAQIDRIMRRSALLQDPERLKKWDSRRGDTTYGETTIARAIADCKGEYGDTLKKSKETTYKPIPDNGKPKIVIREGELPRIIKELDLAIRGKTLRYNDLLVHITRLAEARSYRGLRQAKGTSVITPYDAQSLVLLAAKCANWIRTRKKETTIEEYIADPPINVMKIFLSAQTEWNMPILTGLATCPIVRSDGSLLNKPGYDADTGLYCDFNPKDFPPVKNNPDKKDASSALGLLYAALAEFPFKTDTDRAVALAAMLTTVLRPSVRSAPLFAFSAPCPGTGKSTLADMIGIITTGKPCAAMDFNRDEAEFKKSLFATLLEGSPVVLIDNVIGNLNSSLLYMILSQETIKGRILGASKTATLNTASIWLATGNNLIIGNELARRTLLCILDADTEKPAERAFSRDIYQWTNDHRGELVQAALTILRAYHVEGRPLPDGVKPMNGYDDWSHWIRGALLWLGEADPKDSQLEIEAHDPEREGLQAVFNAWHNQWGSEFVTAKDLLKRGTVINDTPDKQEALYQALEDAVPHRGELTGKKLGNWLARYDGRVIDGLKLINTGEKRQNFTYWKVIKN